MHEYAVVGRFLSLSQAKVAHGVLDSAGFAPRTRDEQVSGLAWDHVAALGGVRVEVPVQHLEEARELLATRTDLYAAPSEEERPYFAAAARKRRIHGFIALLLVAPVMVPIALFGFLANRRRTETNQGGA